MGRHPNPWNLPITAGNTPHISRAPLDPTKDCRTVSLTPKLQCAILDSILLWNRPVWAKAGKGAQSQNATKQTPVFTRRQGDARNPEGARHLQELDRGLGASHPVRTGDDRHGSRDWPPGNGALVNNIVPTPPNHARQRQHSPTRRNHHHGHVNPPGRFKNQSRRRPSQVFSTELVSNSCLRASLPALLAAAMASKLTGDCIIELVLPAR
jgi:hypothetical protein